MSYWLEFECAVCERVIDDCPVVFTSTSKWSDVVWLFAHEACSAELLLGTKSTVWTPKPHVTGVVTQTTLLIYLQHRLDQHQEFRRFAALLGKDKMMSAVSDWIDFGTIDRIIES